MTDRKVVVVGGGAIGLYAACLLGDRAILCEKDDLPRWKSCGGLLTPEVQRRLTNLGFPTESFAATYYDLDLYFSGSELTIHYDYPIVRALPRLQMSSFLLEKAIQAGAEIRPRTEVLHVDMSGRFAFCSGGNWLPFSDIVIADGAAGIISGHVEARVSPQPLCTLQYELPDVSFDRLATGWSTEYGPNYPWAMGVGKYGLHIGIVGPNPHTLKDRLNRWAIRFGVGLPDRQPDRWVVPYQYRGLNPYPNHYLVGDAAGVASPFTGEGLTNGMLSAEWAIRKITTGENGPAIEQILHQQMLHGALWFGRRRSRSFGSLSNKTIEELAKRSLGRKFLAWFYGMGPSNTKEAQQPG